MLLPNYPYPRFIAHRGGGSAAPENTLAAFRLGMNSGYTMFECDAKLSQDNILFLLHDDDLDRTTSGKGLAINYDWQNLVNLDAGFWHSPRYQSEPLVRLESIIKFVLANDLYLDIEIKPNKGQEYQTGLACVELLQQLTTPSERSHFLFSSFEPTSLQAVYDKDKTLPRALLVHDWHDDVWTTLDELDCAGLITNYTIMNAQRVDLCHQQNRFVMVYTVNDQQALDEMKRYQVDSIITDKIDFIK